MEGFTNHLVAPTIAPNSSNGKHHKVPDREAKQTGDSRLVELSAGAVTLILRASDGIESQGKC